MATQTQMDLLSVPPKAEESTAPRAPKRDTQRARTISYLSLHIHQCGADRMKDYPVVELTAAFELAIEVLQTQGITGLENLRIHDRDGRDIGWTSAKFG